jgi:selenocysteine-specific elongation factor
LVLDEEVSAVTGDRFVLRDEAARQTLGGGVVLQPRPARHRRGDDSAGRLARIEAAPDLPARIAALVLADGRPATPVEWLLEVLPDTAAEIRTALRAAPGLVLLPSADDPEAASPAAALGAIEAAVLSHLAERHRAVPLEPGVEMESVRTSIAPDLVPKLFRAVIADLERRGGLVRAESLLRLPSHAVALAAPERALGGRAERLLAEADLAPPDLRLLEESLGTSRRRLTEILTQLEREGRVVRVGPDLYFAAAALEKARALLVAHLEAHGEISAAGFRDRIQGSRKFSIALLDYFDRTGFTLRVGDLRKLRAGGAKRNG